MSSGRPRTLRPEAERKTHNVMLLLNVDERRALDSAVDRFGVDRQTLLRSIIHAANDGRIGAAQLFER
jgi:hypothetical protein